MFRLALRNLLSRPGRSLLAILGLTVAIAGMVGLFSVAEGIDSTVSKAFGRIPGLIVMEPGSPIPLFSHVPAEWEHELRQVDGVSVVTPEICARANVIENKPVIAPPRLLFGIDMESRQGLERDVYRESIQEGRYLSPADRHTKSVLISRQIAREFKKSVGETLQVNGIDLHIVGIYHTGILLLDVAVIVDIDCLRSMARLDPDTVCDYYIETDASADDAVMKERILSRFRERGLTARHTTSDGNSRRSAASLADLARQLDRVLKSCSRDTEQADSHLDGKTSTVVSNSDETTDVVVHPSQASADDPLEIQNTTDWWDRFNKLRGDLDLILSILTTIGVTIALLSIVNTMLMNVSERVIEFGILKANGWSKRSILNLITFESALLGLTGGLAGAALGWLGTHFINCTWPDRVQLYASVRLLVFSVCFSVALGVLGGLYPAIRATRLSPMESIRRG